MQKAGLQQTLTQTTKLSPAQIQLIRMLELPSIELSQRINEELQENPALEEGRDEELEKDNFAEEGLDDYGYGEEEDYDEDGGHDPLQNADFNYEQYVSDDETPSYMLNQSYNPVDEDQREVAQGPGHGDAGKIQPVLPRQEAHEEKERQDGDAGPADGPAENYGEEEKDGADKQEIIL